MGCKEYGQGVVFAPMGEHRRGRIKINRLQDISERKKPMIVMKIDQKEYQLIQRKTNRYGVKGSLANNQGYLMVYRDPKTGRFQRKTLWNKLVNFLKKGA